MSIPQGWAEQYPATFGPGRAAYDVTLGPKDVSDDIRHSDLPTDASVSLAM